jgi:hypothetical protein
VVLESAKNQIFGVDTPGQHVLPRVQYGMTCLLIRNTIGSVSCSIEWGLASYFVIFLNHRVQEGMFVWETFVTTCSDLWAIHQWKCENGKKEVSLVARAEMKSLLVGIGRYLCKVYNYHDSRACSYKQFGILF